jgi:hypothetical protein
LLFTIVVVIVVKHGNQDLVFFIMVGPQNLANQALSLDKSTDPICRKPRVSLQQERVARSVLIVFTALLTSSEMCMESQGIRKDRIRILMKIASKCPALKYATICAFGQPFVVMASIVRVAGLAKKDTRGPLLLVTMA